MFEKNHSVNPCHMVPWYLSKKPAHDFEFILTWWLHIEFVQQKSSWLFPPKQDYKKVPIAVFSDGSVVGDSTKIVDKVASSEATLKSAGVEATWIEINYFFLPAVVITIIVIIVVVVVSCTSFSGGQLQGGALFERWGPERCRGWHHCLSLSGFTFVVELLLVFCRLENGTRGVMSLD